MHDDQPTLIMVKRSIAGPDIINPGMGFMAARKAMLHAEGLDAGAPCPHSGKDKPPAEPASKDQMDQPSGDHVAERKEIAEQLYKASEMHKGQADRLMKYVEGDSQDESDSEGEKKELY